ncbi:MAG: nucleotidyltransferase domain-containing protein [Ktedonobacteraceae bacterium]|nr:nucleotidyltransferase domain-containing protein [Ktedonobacteraceae bacterium]
MEALEAAKNFVAQTFPACDAAFLGGSVVRGEATATSDLDIVIVTQETQKAYRQSLYASGWPVEAFVNTPESYRAFFASDAQRRRPSLPRMCAEGIILRERDGCAERIQREAQALLDQGPEPLNAAEVTQLRYQLTDSLDDFAGSVRPGESFFLAATVAELATELILGYHRQWIGKGKWVLRALHAFDVNLAQRLRDALENFSQREEKDQLIVFAQDALQLVGGRLFDGYSL